MRSGLHLERRRRGGVGERFRRGGVGERLRRGLGDLPLPRSSSSTSSSSSSSSSSIINNNIIISSSSIRSVSLSLVTPTIMILILNPSWASPPGKPTCGRVRNSLGGGGGCHPDDPSNPTDSQSQPPGLLGSHPRQHPLSTQSTILSQISKHRSLQSHSPALLPHLRAAIAE
jgi:hypothetical protein